MRPMILFATLLCAGGCTCGASHTLDAGAGLDAATLPDAARPDAARPDSAAHDAGMPRAPFGQCEDVFSGTGEHTCAPETMGFCGEERCCYLSVHCVDGTLAPGEMTCTDDPVEPSCALTAPNADVTVTVDGTTFPLRFAYADHGVGFATYVDLTFTNGGNADVCTAQRLSISYLAPDFEIMDGEPAYDGTHDVTFQWTDETAMRPYRFFTGQVTITSSLAFRRGGPVNGNLSADEAGLSVSGTFDAPECEPWRTSGS